MPDQPSDSPDAPQGASHSDVPDHSAARDANVPTSPDSVLLLSQILQRLQHMEGGLSQHEEWLRRIEQEQRQDIPATESGGQGEQELQRLVGSLTIERDKAQKSLAEAQQQLGQYQKDLVTLRQRTTELQTRLTQREQELAGLKTNAGKGEQQARTLHAEAQRQLTERQQQLQALQADFAKIKQQIQQRDARIAELQATLEQSAEKFQTLSADLQLASADDGDGHAASHGRAWSRFARLALVAAFASALISVGLTSWLYEHGRNGTPQLASATLVLPGLNREALDAVVKRAQQSPGIEALPDYKLETVELRSACSIEELDKLAGSLLADVPAPAYASATQPSTTADIQAIAARVSAANDQLSSTTRPAASETPLPAPAELSARWQQLQQERSQIAGQIADLQPRLVSKQTQPAAATVAPEEIAKAEAADPQLQAETEALKQRHDQLAGRLRVSIDTAALQFESLQKALTEADGQMQKTLQDNHPEEVKTQLNTVRESLKTWARSLTDLDAAWKRQRSLLEASNADVMAVQADLERSARAFGSETAPANSAFTQAIEAIGQGQDQTTKRLVLRNALIKQLTPVTTAQQAVAAAARAVILTEDVELAGIVQRYNALRQQLENRRTQIANGLRQQLVAEAQKKQSVRTAQARQQHDELSRRAAEIDASLLKLAEQSLQVASAESAQAQWLAARTDLLERRSADLQQLAKIHEDRAAKLASLPPPPAPGCLPARILGNAADSRPLISALLLGSTPALACAAVLALSWLVISSRRSHQTIEEYARTLKETARRQTTSETK